MVSILFKFNTAKLHAPHFTEKQNGLKQNKLRVDLAQVFC